MKTDWFTLAGLFFSRSPKTPGCSAGPDTTAPKSLTLTHTMRYDTKRNTSPPSCLHPPFLFQLQRSRRSWVRSDSTPCHSDSAVSPRSYSDRSRIGIEPQTVWTEARLYIVKLPSMTSEGPLHEPTVNDPPSTASEFLTRPHVQTIRCSETWNRWNRTNENDK